MFSSWWSVVIKRCLVIIEPGLCLTCSLSFLLLPWVHLLACAVMSERLSEIAHLSIFPQPFPEARYLRSPVKEEKSGSLVIKWSWWTQQTLSGHRDGERGAQYCRPCWPLGIGDCSVLGWLVGSVGKTGNYKWSVHKTSVQNGDPESYWGAQKTLSKRNIIQATYIISNILVPRIRL